MVYYKLVAQQKLPLFSPGAIHIQIVPYSMVVKWISSKFQTLWSNLKKMKTIRIICIVDLSITKELYIYGVLTKLSTKAIKFPINLGAGWEGPFPEGEEKIII